MTMNPADPFAELAERAEAPRPEVLEAIRRDLSTDTRPRRNLSRSQRAGLSAFALAIGLVLTSVNALRQHPQSFLLTGAAFCLSAAGLLLAGALPGGKSRWGLPVRRYVLAVLAIGVFAFLASQAESFLAIEAFTGNETARGAMLCAGHALISGVVGSSALMFLWRRSDPFSPALSGAFLGFLGGVLGTVSVGMLCHHGEGFHLTLGHGGSVLLLTIVGAWIGRRWLSP